MIKAISLLFSAASESG